MKFYDDILNSNLSFEVANKLMKNKKQFATRPCWDGFHFYDKNGKYCILLKNGKVDNYVKEAEYENDDLLGPIYLDQLVPFKKGVNKALGIYIAVVALITYLAYFLKPTLAFFEGKREDKKKTVAQARKIAEKEEKLLVENEVLEVEEFQEEIEEESKKLEVTTEEELVIEEEPKVIQEDLNSNTVAELKEMAKDLGITGYSTLRKQELIDIINKHK